MKYYKVNSKYDNLRRYKRKNNYLELSGIYVGNELFTQKEIEKIEQSEVLPKCFYNDLFQVVEISKSKIYWCFGCRFYEAV